MKFQILFSCTNDHLYADSYYGVSRSVAVVIAFLMKKYCMSFDEAYKKYELDSMNE